MHQLRRLLDGGGRVHIHYWPRRSRLDVFHICVSCIVYERWNLLNPASGKLTLCYHSTCVRALLISLASVVPADVGTAVTWWPSSSWID